MSGKLASSKISGILGTSNKNSAINKRLANAGFSHLKVGKLGIDDVVQTLYRELGHGAISNLVSNGFSSIISILGGVL